MNLVPGEESAVDDFSIQLIHKLCICVMRVERWGRFTVTKTGTSHSSAHSKSTLRQMSAGQKLNSSPRLDRWN